MKLIFVLFALTLFALTVSFPVYPQVFWEERPSGVTVPLNSVSDYDNFNCWICGDSATVLRTTNRGYNWINVSRNGIPANVNLVSIFVLPGSQITSALAAGYSASNSYVFLTTNSGNNWVQVFSQANGFINAIWLTSPSSGFMTGSPVNGRWSLWKTTNGGVNWDSAGLFLAQNGSEKGRRNSLWFSGSNIWFGTDKGRVYFSTNSGFNWTSQSVLPDTLSNALWFDAVSANLGYSAGNRLMKSTSNGSIWISDSLIIGSGQISGVTGSTQIFNSFYYTRGSSVYLKYGSYPVWNTQYTAPSGIYNHMSMARTGYGYGPGWIFAVRNNGGISRANTIVEGVRLISNEIPKIFCMYQNYPNPFNSTTRFKFDSRLLTESLIGEVRGGNIKISIFNALGQEIETLIDKVLQPAVYEITWDGSNYASGIYFYRMLVTNPNGGYTVYNEIKKMLMIK